MRDDYPCHMSDDSETSSRMPRWVWKAAIVFWAAYLGMLVVRHGFHRLSSLLVLVLVSLFLSLAIEPGVTRLANRGWRRGRATILILLGLFAAVLVFVVAIGTLVGTQVADLAQNSERYVNRTVNFLNDNINTKIDAQKVNDAIQDPDGPLQRFIKSQQDEALQLSVAALGFLLQAFSVLLFTFYLVADGPKMRRAICSRLAPDRQRRVLATWELAIDKTGGYLYSRALLAAVSAFAHWIVFQLLGTAAPIALAIWVGLISQFIPVIGTYVAGVLPLLITFIDSPPRALVVLLMVVLYQQVENFFVAPRITARTMEIHPAISFGSAIAGAALLGPVGAVLGLPVAAMAVALASAAGERHELVDNPLVQVPDKTSRRSRKRHDASAGERRRLRRGRGA